MGRCLRDFSRQAVAGRSSRFFDAGAQLEVSESKLNSFKSALIYWLIFLTPTHYFQSFLYAFLRFATAARPSKPLPNNQTAAGTGTADIVPSR